MHDAELSPDRHERVVAVYPDEAAAQRAAMRAKARGALDVAVNDPDDEVRVGLASSEMTHHAALGAWVGTLAGAILAVPLGLIELGDLSSGLGLLIAAVCGGTAGGVFGFLIGGYLGERRRSDLPLPEERGSVVGIRGGHRPGVEALADSGALRVRAGGAL